MSKEEIIKCLYYSYNFNIGISKKALDEIVEILNEKRTDTLKDKIKRRFFKQTLGKFKKEVEKNYE